MCSLEYKTIDLGKDGEIYVAKIQNGLNDSQLSEIDSEKLSKITGNGRRDEFLTTRALLSEVFKKGQILYSDLGAPYLQDNSKNISISHCKSYVAIFISDFCCAIDVENSNREFARAAKRYLTPNDALCGSNLEMGIAWCSKETIFKLFKGIISDMIGSICVEKIDSDYTLCSVDNRVFKVNINHFEGLIVCWATLETA